MRAEDLAQRGIPSYRNASGDVSEITDETGAALTGYDQRNGIAYDSKGQPKAIQYDETGGPRLVDPFADMPLQTDKKTGDQFKKGRGLYQWEGTDQTVVDANTRAERDKDIQKQSALLGRKLSLDEYDLTHGTHEHKALRKDLVSQVPTLADPKFEGADEATVRKGIDEHFDAQYAATEANATKGWFSKDLSPEAIALRDSIDKRKEAAYQTADNFYALKERLAGLNDTVSQSRAQERVFNEQLLAHAQGNVGPLDEEAQAAAKEPERLYPPVEDWPRMLGKMPAADAPQQMSMAVKDGTVPSVAGPATVAAAHDAADAQKKADELRDSNPTLADQFEAAAKGILTGLGNGVAELVKSPIGQGVIGLNPLSWAAAAAGKGTPEELSKKFADSIVAGNPHIEKRLEGTIGGKLGNFAGGVLPYVAATIASGPASPIVDASLFFSSGYQNTYDDARAHGADENVAHGSALANGAINAVLAMPLKTVGKAYEAVFGDTAPKIVSRAIQNAFQHGGPEAVGSMLGTLAEAIKAGGEGSEKLRQEAVDGIGKVLAEIRKPATERLADVAKTAAAHGAIGAGVQTAQNIVSQSYDHDRGTFENVPEQALGFAGLGALSKGFEQVAAARKAKQALDVIAKGGEPPPGTALARSKAGPKAPEGPAAPSGVAPSGVTGEVATTEKVANAREVPTKPAKAVKTAPEVVTPNIAEAEKAYLERGGHTDKLDAQEKLAKLREAFPDPAARVAAIEKHLEPSVSIDKGAQPSTSIDTAAHEAATSTKNDLPEPTQAQKEAGNYQKGHQIIAGLDVSIENPAGSRRQPEFKPLASHYGYIKGTVGADKDHVDIFIKPGTPTDYSGPVFVVNQHDKSGKFDEHKAVMGHGITTEAQAKKEYLSNYESGWTGGKSVVKFESPAAFKEWAMSGAKGKPAVAPLNVVPPEGSSLPKPQGPGEHIVSTAVKQGDKYLVGSTWNEAHEGIGIRHELETVKQSDRGFIVQDADGNQRFVSRKEAGPIAEKAGQTQAKISAEGLQSAELKPIEQSAEGKQNVTGEPPAAKQEAPSTERAPKPSEAKPGDGGVARVEQRGGSGGESGKLTPETTRAHVEVARQKHAAEISALGVAHVEKTLGRSGIAMARDGSAVAVDHTALAKAANTVKFKGGDPQAWISDAYREELIHARDVLTSGHDFDAIHKKIWSALSSETKALVKGVYSGSKSPVHLAAEYVRMVAQFRADGGITEDHHQDTNAMVEALKGEQPKLVESHLAAMESTTRKPWPEFIEKYWAHQAEGPTAFTPERLKLAGISREEMMAAVENAIAKGASEEFVLNATKMTAPKIALEDLANYEPAPEPKPAAQPGVKYVLPSFVTEAHVRADTRARAERLKDLGDRLNALPEVPATDLTVIRTLLNSTTAKALDQAEAKIAKLEEKHAATTRKDEGDQSPQLPRVPPRADVQPHQGEIREGASGQAGGGGGPVERGEAPPKKPGARRASEKPASSLDAETQQALKDAIKDLFAGEATNRVDRSLVEIHEIDRNGALVLRPNKPSVELLRDYSRTAGALKQLIDCLER